jgi:integrase
VINQSTTVNPVLAEALKRWQNPTLYSKAIDWVFATYRKNGKIPRSASTCGKKDLRPAAVTAGVIPEDYTGRFGWHNMRHSLATFLAGEVDSSVTMKMLRHKKFSTTLEGYSHSVNSKQGEAQKQRA